MLANTKQLFKEGLKKKRKKTDRYPPSPTQEHFYKILVTIL